VLYSAVIIGVWLLPMPEPTMLPTFIEKLQLLQQETVKQVLTLLPA